MMHPAPPLDLDLDGGAAKPDPSIARERRQ